MAHLDFFPQPKREQYGRSTRSINSDLNDYLARKKKRKEQALSDKWLTPIHIETDKIREDQRARQLQDKMDTFTRQPPVPIKELINDPTGTPHSPQILPKIDPDEASLWQQILSKSGGVASAAAGAVMTPANLLLKGLEQIPSPIIKGTVGYGKEKDIWGSAEDIGRAMDYIADPHAASLVQLVQRALPGQQKFEQRLAEIQEERSKAEYSWWDRAQMEDPVTQAYKETFGPISRGALNAVVDPLNAIVSRTAGVSRFTNTLNQAARDRGVPTKFAANATPPPVVSTEDAARMSVLENEIKRLTDVPTVERNILPSVEEATTGKVRMYHGSPSTFQAFDVGRANDQALYGPGIYFTADPSIASGYSLAKPRSGYIQPVPDNILQAFREQYNDVPLVMNVKQIGQERFLSIDTAGWKEKAQAIGFEPVLLQGHRQELYRLPKWSLEAAPNIRPVTIRLNKVLDIDAPADKELLEGVQADLASYIDDPPYWLGSVSDESWDLLEGKISNPTNKQVYKMIVQLSEPDFPKRAASDLLSAYGYDGITHIGGGITGSPAHRVVIAIGDDFGAVDQAITSAPSRLTGEVTAASTIGDISQEHLIGLLDEKAKLQQKYAKQASPDTTTPSGRIQKMWQDKDRRTSGPQTVEGLGTRIRTPIVNALDLIRVHTLDEYTKLNKLTRRIKKAYEQATGENMPLELDAEMHWALMGGAKSAGHDKGYALLKQVDDVLKPSGGKLDKDYVNQYLFAKHHLSVLAKYPNRKKAGGISKEDLEQLVPTLRRETTPAEFERIETAARLVRNFYRDQLSDLWNEGLIKNKLYNDLSTAYPWYNPIEYSDELIGSTHHADNIMPVSVSDPRLKSLSETGLDAVPMKSLDLVIGQAIKHETLLFRNRAARSVIRMIQSDMSDSIDRVDIKKLKATTVGGRKISHSPNNTISYLDNGIVQVYEVPPWLAQIAHARSQLPTKMSSALNLIQSGPRALLVTYNPVFMSYQFLYDMATVMLTRGELPWNVALAALRNMGDLMTGSKGMQDMIRAGGDVTGYWGRTNFEGAKFARDNNNIVLQSSSDLKKYMKKMRDPITGAFGFVRDIGRALEQGPRRAVFESELRAGKAMQEAALAARRSTVDFARAGTSVRLANKLFLFLNAAVQGFALPARALRDSTKARAMLGAYMGASAGLWYHNQSYEEYQDIPDHVKYGSMIIMLPSKEYDQKTNRYKPHYFSIWPQMRQWAAPYAAVTKLLDMMTGQDSTSTMEFASLMSQEMAPWGPITKGPIPLHVGQAAFDLARGYDTFRDREIVPEELKGKPRAEQFDERTPEIYKILGRYTNMSPKMLQFAGSRGIMEDILMGANVVIRQMEDDIDPEIDRYVTQLREMEGVLPPDMYNKQRKLLLAEANQDFLSQGMGPNKVNEIIEALKKPELEIPMIDRAIRRVYSKRGGQIYKNGLKLKAKELKIDEDTLRRINKTMSANYEDFREFARKQEYWFKYAEPENRLTGLQYREALQNERKKHHLALLALGVEYPSWIDYHEDPSERRRINDIVNTLGGKIKDVRTAGQLLWSAYLSISPPTYTIMEVLDDGTEIQREVEDINEFFKLREEFEQSLSPQNLKALQSMKEVEYTESEREFEEDLVVARLYWQLEDDYLGNNPSQQHIYQKYKTQKGRFGVNHPIVQMLLQSEPWIQPTENTIRSLRQDLREDNQRIDYVLAKYGYPGLVRHPENIADPELFQYMGGMQRDVRATVE